jgi:hypothetical protein
MKSTKVFHDGLETSALMAPDVLRMSVAKSSIPPAAATSSGPNSASATDRLMSTALVMMSSWSAKAPAR